MDLSRARLMLETKYLVEAVLTSSDLKRLLHAQSMKVLVVKDVSGGKWQTSSNSDNECFGCSTVTIDSVPYETERIVANARLMPEGAFVSGICWIARELKSKEAAYCPHYHGCGRVTCNNR